MGDTARPRVAVVPGDDAAPEAVHATMLVLEAMELPIDWAVLPDGGELAELPRDERTSLLRGAVDTADTTLFGATSGTTGIIGYLRWGKGTFANVRPVRWREGVPSPLRRPEGIDYVIVRENLEDVYAGVEGDLATLRQSGLDLRPFGGRLAADAPEPVTNAEGRFAVKVVTVSGTERVAHFACRLALRRQEQGRPGKVTCATKRNVVWQSDGLFADTVARIVGEYPGLTYEEFLTDDLARRLVASPQELDVVLLANLYGDLLSDEGAATVGGLGLCPSGCYGDDFAYFEPVHGTAPDIKGEHAINPTATLLSAVMMLEHLGRADDAGRLERAVDETLRASDVGTPDLGGSATTMAFAEAVAGRVG